MKQEYGQEVESGARERDVRGERLEIEDGNFHVREDQSRTSGFGTRSGPLPTTKPLLSTLMPAASGSGWTCTYSIQHDRESSRATLGIIAWRELGVNQTTTSRVCVSVELPSLAWELFFWATCGDQVRVDVVPSMLTSKDTQVIDLLLPEHLIGDKLSHSLPIKGQCTVHLVKPVPLSTVYLSIDTRDAYQDACKTNSSLLQWLRHDTPLIRQGNSYTSDCMSVVGIQNQRHTFHVSTTEPVMQGYVTTSTKIVLTLPSTTNCCPSGEVPGENREASLEPDELRIDENFLANSVFSSLTPALSRVNTPNCFVQDANDPKLSNTPRGLLSADIPYIAIVLRQPLPHSGDYHVYLGMGMLSKVGVLDGDWVRLVRPT
jgi:hypothetical protein